MKDAFFREWLEYFRWNAEEPDTFPWQSRETLGEGEADRIGKSLATFQLGENSEGSALSQFAREYGGRMGFAMLPEITDLFVKEERNHSALLGRFMDKHGIPRRTFDWTDSVFRRMRKPFGFEVSVSVLITAEIIALVYYRALREASSSRLLRSLCNKILEDEKAHVEYESALIRFAQESRGAWRSRFWRLAHKILFVGTVVVVYGEHRRVLDGGGYPFIAFFDACCGEFHRLFPVSATAAADRSASVTESASFRKA
jgi:hypothetical protein